MAHSKNYSLLDNSRFYVLAFSFLLSVAVAAWLRLRIDSDQLFYIRTEQIFGLLSFLYWYLALVISPIGYVIGKHRIGKLEFSRRAIGVSAAYFALLHGAVAVFGQFGGLGQLTYLPLLFKFSLAGGAIGAFVLLIMAATSFDKVIDYMTFPRWKWLHRLVYFGGVLAVLHIWSIGTHLAYGGVQVIAFIALVVLAGLETFRFVALFAKKYPQFQAKDYFVITFVSIWALWFVLIASIPTFIENYNTSHQRHMKAGGHHDDAMRTHQ